MSNPAWDHELDRYREEYEDALFRVAMLELEIEKTEQFMADIEAGRAKIDMEEIEQEVDMSRPKVYALIERELRRSKMRYFVRTTLPRTGIAAACVIAIFSVGAVTTFAASSTVRMKVLELLVNIQEKYTEVTLQQVEGGDFDVPIDWKGNYFPSYTPNGFLVDDVDGMGDWNKVIFHDGEGKRLVFVECEEGTSSQINTEGSAITEYVIHGSKAVCAFDGVTSRIVWAEQNQYFHITLNGTMDEAIKIASSITRIN